MLLMIKGLEILKNQSTGISKVHNGIEYNDRVELMLSILKLQR